MKVSVITVCFNANSVIAACLDSVASQTYPNIEHIIIDGASTDGTLETLARYPHITTLVSEPDTGIYNAMNKGVARATGDYLYFLNADDMFLAPNTLEVAMETIKTLPDTDVVYGGLHVREKNGNCFVFQPPAPEEAPDFLIYGCLPHQATLARRSVFERTNSFDESYRIFGDYDWFLKIFADPEITIRRIDCVIGSYFLGGASTNLAVGQPEYYKIQNNAALYASSKWDKRRIDMYQEKLLELRLQIDQLQQEKYVEKSTFVQVLARFLGPLAKVPPARRG